MGRSRIRTATRTPIFQGTGWVYAGASGHFQCVRRRYYWDSYQRSEVAFTSFPTSGTLTFGADGVTTSVNTSMRLSSGLGVNGTGTFGIGLKPNATPGSTINVGIILITSADSARLSISNTGQLLGQVFTGNVTQASVNGGSISLNTKTSLAMSFATNDVRVSVAGAATVQDTSATMASSAFTSIRLGDPNTAVSECVVLTTASDDTALRALSTYLAA